MIKNKINEDSLCIVLAHANTDEKKDILMQCVRHIKSELAIVSNYPIDKKFQNIADWVLYTNKNEILHRKDFEKFGVDYNYSWTFEDGKTVHIPADYEHGYAVYCLIRRALLFAKSIGKKNIQIINYDYIIPNSTIQKNFLDLEEYDLITYDMPILKNTYSTSLFCGNIDVLLYFFNLLKSPTDYYAKTINGKYFSIIEAKFTYFYKYNPFKIKENKLEDLPHGSKIDIETGFPSLEEFIEKRIKDENGNK